MNYTVPSLISFPASYLPLIWAEAKGLDPDHPRALKLVTRTI